MRPIIATLIALFFCEAGLLAQDNRSLERESSTVPSDKRLALVIGNSNYVTSPLANPANDAADMAAALRALDFTVISGVNQSRADMIRLVRQFGEQLKARGGVGLGTVCK
jgi:hypothetical protein